MDQHNAPLRPPFDDIELDDAPDLTTGDQDAIDAIRRQLEEEYPGSSDDPAPAPSTASQGRAPRRWWTLSVVAGLVTVAAFGGGAVGALVTVHALRDSAPLAPTGTDATTLALGREPDAGTGAPPPALSPPAPPADHVRPAAPRPSRPRTTVVARAAAPSPGEAVKAPPSRPVAPGAAVAASPPGPWAENGSSRLTAPDASSKTVPWSTDPRNGVPPLGGPEPQAWSDPSRPPSTETAAHAGLVKAAFSSPPASPVPAPAPPSPPPPLAAPRAPSSPPRVLREPSPTPDIQTSAPASSPREEGRLKAIREDWETMKRGFASAPEDFKQAWGSFTRDLKGLLDR